MAYKTQIGLDVPIFEKLYCINCQIHPADADYSIIKSEVHSSALTCRMLIYHVKNCLAAPATDMSSKFHLIVDRAYYCSGHLQDYLKSLKVQFFGTTNVRPEIYKICLDYTFAFKLAPSWNLAGKFYLRESNFLTLSKNIDAIGCNIVFDDQKAILELIPMVVNLFPITLDSLGVTSTVKNDFVNNSKCTMDSINLTLFYCPWVYVLPKLTQARVVSVSKKLPISCPFDTYTDLRRHWKNMYFYKLPKTDQGMLFYEVIFPKYPNHRFVYPDICIFSKMPEIQTHTHKCEICLKFTDDLNTYIPTICGKKLNFYPIKLNIEDVMRAKYNNNDESGIKKSNVHQLQLLGKEAINQPNMMLAQYDQIVRYEEKTQSRPEDFAKNAFLKQKIAEIDILNDVTCYYDIPAMLPDNVNTIFSNTEETAKAKNNPMFMARDEIFMKNSNYTNVIEANEERPQQLKIKNVENVCYNLSHIRKIEKVYEGKVSNAKPSEDKMNVSTMLCSNRKKLNLFNQINHSTPATITLHNKSEDNIYFDDFKMQESTEVSQKDDKFKKGINMQTTIISEHEQSEKEDYKKSSQSSENKSYDIVKSLLSQFTESSKSTQNHFASTKTNLKKPNLNHSSEKEMFQLESIASQNSSNSTIKGENETSQKKFEFQHLEKNIRGNNLFSSIHSSSLYCSSLSNSHMEDFSYSPEDKNN